MKKTLVLITALVVVLLAAVGLYNALTAQYTPTKPDASASGDESEPFYVPDFTVVDADGNPVSLSDFSGTPVVINFWATWCGPCKEELPYFETAYETYGEDVIFMMVNMTDGGRETVEGAKEFVEDRGYTFPVYFDTQLDAAVTYGINSIPVTLLVDANGILTGGQIGMVPEEPLMNAIAAMLE